MSNTIGHKFLILLPNAASFTEVVPVNNAVTARQIVESKYPNAKQITPSGVVHG